MEPDWSPDGAAVVFARGDAPGQHAGGHSLWMVEVATGDEHLLYRAPPKRGEPYRLYSPVWSPDGEHIAFSRSGGKQHGVWLMDRDGSNVRRIVADIGLSYDTPALTWSPSGDALAFNGLTRRQYGLHVMDLHDRRPRMFDSFGEWPAWSPDGSAIAYFFYVSDARWRLVVKDPRGGPRETVPGTPTLGYVYGRLDWARCPE